MIEKNHLKSSIVWSLLARGFGAGSGFLITALMTRLLSVEALGVYYLVLNIIRFGSHFVKVGMEISLQKLLGVAATEKNWAIIAIHLASVGTIIAISSTILLALMWLCWNPLIGMLQAPVLAPMLFIVFILIVFRSIEEIGSAFFRGVHEARIGVFLVDAPRQLVMLILLAVVFMSLGNLSAEHAIKTYLVSSFSAIFFIFVLLGMWCRKHKIHTHYPRPAEVKAQSKANFSLSSPMMVQGIAVLLNSTFDIWVLGIFSNKEDIAVYGTIVRLVALVTLIMSVSTMVTPPLMAALYQKGDKSGIERLLKMVNNGSALIIMPLILTFIFFGKPLLSIMFGPQFEAGYPMLCVLSFAYGFLAITGSPGWLLQMAGQHRHLMRTSIGTGIFNMTANIFAAKYWGGLGVAVVTSIALIAQDSMNTYFAYHKLGIRTWFNPFRKIN